MTLSLKFVAVFSVYIWTNPKMNKLQQIESRSKNFILTRSEKFHSHWSIHFQRFYIVYLIHSYSGELLRNRIVPESGSSSLESRYCAPASNNFSPKLQQSFSRKICDFPLVQDLDLHITDKDFRSGLQRLFRTVSSVVYLLSDEDWSSFL